MATLVGLALGGWLGWRFGFQVGFALFSASLFWVGPVLLFLVGFVVGKGLVSAFTSRLSMSGGGFWTGSLGRRIIGLTADGIIWMIEIVILAWVVAPVVIVPLERVFPEGSTGYNVTAVAVLIGIVLLAPKLERPLKIAIGKGSRPLRRAWRSLFVGVGGSSRFAGLLEEWANPWKPGQIALGNSLYDPDWRVGKPDDRHFITIATSRSGKGRSGIVPNLLTWPGSTLVIDPKGENAAITAKRRGRMGHAVRIVDPFDVLGDLGLHEKDYEAKHGPYPVFRFNPLAEVDSNSLNVVGQIREITEAMVVPSSKTNPFFDDASKVIISGVIAHVLSSPNVKDEDRHLGTVRDYMVKANGRDLTEMIGNTALGGLPAVAAMALKTASTGGGGDVMLTVQVHTEWLDDLAMRLALSSADFSLKELKANPVTIYLVLPGDNMDMYSRFLRLFVNLALRAAGKGKRPDHGILFVLDEFNALGSLPILSSSAGLIAGFGVKLWPICQNLGQIKDRYPDTWETFLGNAGMWQVFAINDRTTAEYMSGRLGHHISWRRVNRGGLVEWEPAGATWLRTSVELARESSRSSGNQLVFCEGEDTFLLRRTGYDEIFKPSEYSPNPYIPHAIPIYGVTWADRMDSRWRAWLKRRFNIDLDAMDEPAPAREWAGAEAAPPSAADRMEEPEQRVAPVRHPGHDIDWSKMGQSPQQRAGNGVDRDAQQGPTVAAAEQGQGADMTAWPEVAELPPAQKPKRARRNPAKGV